MLKNHHTNPAFLLSGFTCKGNKTAPILVLSKEYGCWALKTRTPRTIGKKWLFYRVPEGITIIDDGKVIEDKSIYEKNFCDLESETAPVVREIRKKEMLPQGEKLFLLLDFVLLTALRVPAYRQGIVNRANEADKQEYLRNPASLTAAHLEEISRVGKQLRPLIQNRDRNWALHTIVDSSYEFISSDNPVSLFRSNQGHASISFRELCDPLTDIYLPLSKKLALIGSYDPNNQGVIEAKIPFIAGVNTLTSLDSNQLYFSKEERFIWAKSNGTTGDLVDFQANSL